MVDLSRAAFVAALPVEATSARLSYRSLYPTDAGALREMGKDVTLYSADPIPLRYRFITNT